MVRWVTSYVHVRDGSGAGVGAVIRIYGSAEPEQKEIITDSATTDKDVQ
jgi:hypothetical protein